jgi:antitoxin VapB
LKGEYVELRGRRWIESVLNIKNDSAQRLARELASATGESMTVAVREAIRFERVRGSKAGLAERLLKIGTECASRLKEPCKSIDYGELLYDEKGLPK